MNLEDARHEWTAAKLANGHALILYRYGEWYEAFFEDAFAVASALDLSLNRLMSGRMPFTFFAYFWIDDYKSRLESSGRAVVVVESPFPGRGC